MAQTVKHPPAIWETRVQSLGGEDPLAKEMDTHSSYPCLENSMGRGAWYATVHGVTKSQTRLSNFTHSLVKHFLFLGDHFREVIGGMWTHYFMVNKGEDVERVTDFLFLGSKITADGDCSHEIRRRLLRGRKAMINLDNMLKSRDITLLTKVCTVKAVVFPVVTYGCESWTIKKVEQQRIDAFELQCWRRLLKVTGQQGDQASQSGKTAGEAETSEFWSSDEN